MQYYKLRVKAIIALQMKKNVNNKYAAILKVQFLPKKKKHILKRKLQPI